ncbi:MAG: tetratricopeptide repeat protein [Armatimonadetes bacterium]|nr:tetratricopeptide repeat protein [Armatimonadota bacterium]
MRLLGLVCLACLSVAPCSGQELKGAKHVVDRMIAAPKEAGEGKSEFERLISAYTTEAGSMSAAEAGERWVDLLKMSFSVGRERSMFGMSDSEPPIDRVMAALPPPESWPAIQSAVARIGAEEVPEGSIGKLAFLSALLNSDVDAQERAISGLVEGATDDRRGSTYQLHQLYAHWGAAHRDKGHIKRSLAMLYQDEEMYYGGFSAAILLLDPADRDEIVKLYFENISDPSEPYGATEELLRFYRAAALKYGSASSESGWQVLAAFGTREQFEEYCRKSGAFKSVIEDRELTEAIVNLQEDGTYKTVALAYYIVNLAIDGFGDDAVKILLSKDLSESSLRLDAVDLDELRLVSKLARIAETLGRVLDASPGTQLWTVFATASARSRNGELLISVSRRALASDNLPADLRPEVQVSLARGLLAADRMDAAIDLLLRISEQNESGRRIEESHLNTVLSMILDLGLVLDRDDIIDTALARMSGLRNQYTSYTAQLYADRLIQTDRLVRAETLLLTAIEQSLSDLEMSMYGISQIEGLAGSLLKLYAKAGRYDDVVYMLVNAPAWPWEDLSDSLDEMGSDVAISAATALHKIGRSGEALNIVKDALIVASGNDRAYELLVDIAGADSVELLDQLFELDPFEERPVIWKAQVMLNAGDYDAAERLARQAVSIDPSDGEQGKGDRMRVYAILSEALAKQGEAAEAKMYAGAVQAIRMSEHADDLYAAGLTDRAIALYKDSLDIFEDAYCIQSRLAVQLVESGQPEAAAKHFRKAFELMPDSFGRVESHCFGCEHIFDTIQAQDIAMSALLALRKERPDKPQISYLLGYVLDTRGQSEQAVVHYERAVELDPMYLNAWSRLSSSYDSLNAPYEKRERAALAAVRLDPFGKHGGSMYQHSILDLKELWRIGEEAHSKRMKRSDSLFDLPAARKRLAEQKDNPMMMFMMSMGTDEPKGPVSFVLSSRMVSLILQMLEGSGGMFEID